MLFSCGEPLGGSFGLVELWTYSFSKAVIL